MKAGSCSIMKIFDVLGNKRFEEYKENESASEYKNISLVLAVIDAIFSISAKYETTVKVVDRFAKYVGINKIFDEFTVEEFIERFNNFSSIQLANDVFNNRQRTSAVNGILKAEAVKTTIDILHKHQIETKKDLLNYPHKDILEQEIRKIKGQGSGITFHYLMMHAGDVNRFKADRHIYTFFEDYLGYGKLDEYKLEQAFNEQFLIVKNKYNHFTIRALDNLIWNFIKERENYFSEIDLETNVKKYKFMENKKWYVFNKYINKFFITNSAPKNSLNSYAEYLSNFDKKVLKDILETVEKLDYYTGEKLFEPTKIILAKMLK